MVNNAGGFIVDSHSPTIDTHHNLEQFWLDHIQRRSSGNLSKTAYCKKHNLVYHQYIYWEHKFLQTNDTIELIPIEIEQNCINPLPQIIPEEVETNRKQHLLCSLNLKNGNVLQIFDTTALNVLVSILR